MTGRLTFGEFVVVTIAVGTFPLGVAALLLAGPVTAAVVFGTGWLVALPITVVLAYSLGLLGTGERWVDATPSEAEGNPLENLKEQYARGKIDDKEFERKLDRLVEVEGIEVPSELSLPDRTTVRDEEPTAQDREPAFER